jgi:alkyl hydroperoxide reductase subunit AhpC
MSIRLGDIAPDFEQDSSEGRIRFHDWLGDSWGVLFSHPADFTPVCTTELGFTAKLKDDFAQRGVKAIALSVDPVDSHLKWIDDINETQNTRVNFPIIADADRKVSDLYQRHPDRAFAVHHRPEQEGAPDHHLPGQHRTQLQRDPACHRLAAADRQPQGRHPGQLAGRR